MIQIDFEAHEIFYKKRNYSFSRRIDRLEDIDYKKKVGIHYVRQKVKLTVLVHPVAPVICVNKRRKKSNV